MISVVVVDLEGSREPIPEPVASKRFSGKFMVLVPPDMHRSPAVEAAVAGVSLNRLVSAKPSR